MFPESENPVGIDLHCDTGSHVGEIKNCGPESQASRTGSGDPQRFISTDGGGRLEAPARRLWDLREEYSKTGPTGQGFIIQPEIDQCHERDVELHGKLLQSFDELVNAFWCKEEEEEHTMELDGVALDD